MQSVFRRWRSLVVFATGLAALLIGAGPTQPTRAALVSSTAEVSAMETRLYDYPVFYNFDAPKVREIFQRGQSLGIRPNVFTTVGDSNTTNGDFLRPFGLKLNNCDLGTYDWLQPSIDYFSVPVREGQANSFVNDSESAAEGFSSSIVLDPLWATWWLCEANESPLMCEYRVAQPAVSVIMLGQIDINTGHLTADEYRANMDEIVRASVDAGVIPVLTTIVFMPEKDVYPLSLQYDMALLDLADQYQVPLINLWRVVQTFPNHGIGPDHSHLSTRVGSFCAFNGPEQQLGNVQRSLLTLQALDYLRVHVLDSKGTAS